MKVVNRLFNTEPLILHASGPLHLSPLWSQLQTELFREPRPRQTESRQPYTFYTWNSGATHSHDPAKKLGTLERCLERLGVPCRVLGSGIRPWKNILKISTLYDALQDTSTPYVIAADSPDVLVLRSPGCALELFSEFDCEVLYIADSSFWPPEYQDVKVLEEEIAGASSPFAYLNSGVLIGRTAYCRELFKEGMRLAERHLAVPYVEGTSGAGSDADDQSIMKRLYLANYPAVQIDMSCVMFQTLTYQDKRVLRVRRERRIR